MMSDDRMLNTATNMMIDSTQNMTTRSTFSASNSEAFIVCQSVTTALPDTLSARGASICRTLSASVVITSFDRKSAVTGESVSVRVDLGGGRTIKKKTKE